MIQTILVTAFFAVWQNPTPVCTAAGAQENFLALPYADGGVLVLWEDSRSGNVDIYAQALDAEGNALWQKDGIPVVVQPGNQTQLDAVVLESGDVVVAWDDERILDQYSVYAQRIAPNGSLKWSAGGVPIRVYQLGLTEPHLCPSGDGAIVEWKVGEDALKARRLLANGSVAWPDTGKILCSKKVTLGELVSSLSGSMIFSYGKTDWSTSIASFWVQRVDSLGSFLWGDSGIMLYSFHFSSSFYSNGNTVTSGISDGSGGAILQWREPVWRVQRVDSAGTKLWNDSGVVIASIVSSVPGDYCSDSEGGIIAAWGPGDLPPTVNGHRLGVRTILGDSGAVIAAWIDHRYNTLNTHQINSDKSLSWGGGTPIRPLFIDTVTNPFEPPQFCSDGAGGAYFVYVNEYKPNKDNYYDTLRVIHITSSGGKDANTFLVSHNESITLPRICARDDSGAILTKHMLTSYKKIYYFRILT